MPCEPRVSVRAKISCSRCHRRKKKCDRVLPQCGNCVAVHHSCSLGEEDHDSATYPVAFVRSLEERVRELEAQQIQPALDVPQRHLVDHEAPEPDHLGSDSAIGGLDTANDTALAKDGLPHSEQPIPSDTRLEGHVNMERRHTTALSQAASQPRTPQRAQETLAENLRSVSLAAVAEPYLGSISGLTFAKLTQAVLRRLSPDGRDFVFSPEVGGSTGNGPISGATNLHLDFMNNMYFDFDQVIDFSMLAGDGIMPAFDDESRNTITTLPDRAEVLQLAMFYFDHSHTLYPIIHQQEVMSDIHTILLEPEHPITQSPPCMFRVWMVLAIGSTTHSSITLSEESVSRLYYEKAMTYFEGSMDHGDIVSDHVFVFAKRAIWNIPSSQWDAVIRCCRSLLAAAIRNSCLTETITMNWADKMRKVALEAIMLQVSYSFFNQLGPNTWFLVGTAARLAIGMGLHCDQTLQNLSNVQVERRKRLFFSIFMMDRLVSITLGRPFAIHEDDIDIASFSIMACDELDHGFSTTQSSLCQPPLAITQHILRLRQIANDIAIKVYCKRVVARYSAEQRQEVINSIHQDLVDWRQQVPFPLPNIHPRVPQGCLSWYDLNFYTHLTSLYRPSPLFPTLDITRVNILVEAAAMSIRHANSMYLQKRFSFNWLNLLVIYNAVIALVYSVTVQPENLAASLERLRAIDDLELASELFKVLGQKFTAAQTIGSMVSQIIERYRSMSSGTTY